MARAVGANSRTAIAFEATYGTKPASGFIRMPFASNGLGASQPLIDNELLGFGRDPIAPIKDALTVDGDIVVPIDVDSWGHWLKAAFGAPTTTGTGPYTHTFTTGASSLPSFTAEKQMPDASTFLLHTGCRVNQLQWTMQRSGNVSATVGIIGKNEGKNATTQAGTLSEPTLTRFGSFNGCIKRGVSNLANVVSAEVTYSNGLDPVETIVCGGDGTIEDVEPGMASLTGSLTVRFADQGLLDAAINGTASELVFEYTRSTGEEFRITAHEVYLPRPRVQIDGPNGVQATFDYQAALDTSAGQMATIELINSVSSYA